jgi:hypothetical protein
MGKAHRDTPIRDTAQHEIEQSVCLAAGRVQRLPHPIARIMLDQDETTNPFFQPHTREGNAASPAGFLPQ